MWPEISDCRGAVAQLVSDKKTKQENRTGAIDIPEKWRRPLHEWNNNIDHDDDELIIDQDTEMIPPHIYAARRRAAEKMASSVCSGQGRTLKGRDLRSNLKSIKVMVEELQECEVLWPHDNKCESSTIFALDAIISYTKPSSGTDQKTRNKKESSRPMEIIQQGGCSWPHVVYHHDQLGNKDNDDDDDDDERLPPHVLVARRFTDRMAYSVCTGNGRTLKGRDLRHVRNSVLKMTGFLER
ncbi:hypothetical protein J5N97_019409 [Dioscorea zingiberensis]|uniref:Uncharacterized protein n=1 Tax=Dioscorea zingiberensis TaxID=325984 RepID=A0A9D5CEP4_9LILI|nr:hypothetical protein J5N97_019409 [Dioscorea zingiberensis]